MSGLPPLLSEEYFRHFPFLFSEFLTHTEFIFYLSMLEANWIVAIDTFSLV